MPRRLRLAARDLAYHVLNRRVEPLPLPTSRMTMLHRFPESGLQCWTSGQSLIARTSREETRMAKAKAEGLAMIQKLPDDVTTGTIMEELFFTQQVAKGLQDVAEGWVLTQEELKERIAKWHKSAGR
jgi:hypothetical protein